MSRVIVRRSLTAGGIYLSVGFGFLATVVATRRLPSAHEFGMFALIVTATGFTQAFFDLTVEEAVVKYGFRYVARADWGRLRQLFREALRVKLIGSTLGALGLVVLALFSSALFSEPQLEVPMMIASLIPLGQSLEGLAGTALYLRGRYDIRSAFLVWSMVLRLAAIALAAPHGLRTLVSAIVLAQAVSTCSIGVAGIAAFRRFPQRTREHLADDRRPIARFVLQSSLATGVIAVRNGLAPLFLGIVTSPTQLGYFRIAQAPQSGMQALSAPARMVLLTEQTRDWEHGRQSEVLRGVRRYTLAATALMVVAVPPLIVFMPVLIRLVYTARYLPATNAARIFVLTAAVLFIVGWTKSFPVAVGRPNLRVITHGAESLVILPLTIVFGELWGATGAALAMFVGMCVFAIMWGVIVIRTKAVDHEPWVAAVDVVKASPDSGALAP
jgi:O-antigen/teichoic acid export membrane protein